MAQLQPDGLVDLPGVRIRSDGVAAYVDGSTSGGPASDRGPGSLEQDLEDHGVTPGSATILGQVITESALSPVARVTLDDITVATGHGPTRGVDTPTTIELDVEAPPDGHGQIILEVDASGVISWYLPEHATHPDATRRPGEETFKIPVRQATIPGEPPPGADRALLGFGLRKVLQVLRYPLRWAAGEAADLLVSAWESRARPHSLRLLSDGGLDGDDRVSLSSSQLQALDGRPALLLLHGTFSNAASAFGALAADAALIQELRARYEDRILVFDHPTVSTSPVDNARWLIERVPPDVDLVLDVVAHSRGGLVARALTAELTFKTPGGRPPRVQRTVHVATPNTGTPLASPRRVGALLDVVTNLAMLTPDAASVPLVAVIETLKHVATGVLEGLDGLASMDIDGELLPALVPSVQRDPGRVLAIASDFHAGSGPIPLRALDVLADTYFGAGNDLVVPSDGVALPGSTVWSSTPGAAGRAIHHSGYFQEAAVRHDIADWLLV
jgi:hypothetical protein